MRAHIHNIRWRNIFWISQYQNFVVQWKRISHIIHLVIFTFTLETLFLCSVYIWKFVLESSSLCPMIRVYDLHKPDEGLTEVKCKQKPSWFHYFISAPSCHVGLEVLRIIWQKMCQSEKPKTKQKMIVFKHNFYWNKGKAKSFYFNWISWAFRLRWKKEKKKWSKKRETVSTWLLWFQYTFPVTDQRRHLIKPREKSLTPSPERGLPSRSKIVRSRLPEERTINFCWFKCNLVVIIILRKRLQNSLKLLLPSLGLVNEPSSRPRPHSSATALTVHFRK